MVKCKYSLLVHILAAGLCLLACLHAVAIDSGLFIVTYSVLYKEREAQRLAGCQ